MRRHLLILLVLLPTVESQVIAQQPRSFELTKLELSSPVQHDNVRVRLAAFTGDFTIDGWTNNKPSDRFWTNLRVSGRDLSLPVTFDNSNQWVTGCLRNPNCANQSIEWLGKIMADNAGVPIDTSYKAEVTTAFNGLIQTLQTPLTTTQSNEVALQNFIKTGSNTVHYKVSPNSPTWSVLVQLFTVGDGGVPTVVQETYLDDKTGGAAPVITLNVVK